MSEQSFAWEPVAIVLGIAAIPFVGTLIFLALSSSSSGGTSGGGEQDLEVERHPTTDKIIGIHGKTVRVVVLPDWLINYVEFDTKEEKEALRKTLMGLEFEEELKILKITDQRIYFEESNPGHNPEAKVDAKFEPLREGKRAEWRAKGYPEGMIEKALTWAEEYTIGMAAKITTDPALRFRVEQELYPKALEMSNKWISGFLEFLK